eukprot:CAMPEP_0184328858 /NCGR_PEP_ID=MMETSP1049-20130417/143843_1 /TAXON_ID=77928 /ORGANISM="Proteomonas sulcata, Strain CCMP704" /LENGTH=78 /DNA_ID=CAMNT_0026651191 /DNA_START=576 /DNA_END=812 /DNA_ORIENTATION=-
MLLAPYSMLKLVYGGGSGVCTSDGLSCFDGSPASDAISILDRASPPEEDQWTPRYDINTKFGGGPGMGAPNPYDGNEI